MKTDPHLSEIVLNACIHCGLCLTTCPTYLTTGLEAESPRGRLMLMEQVGSGAAFVPQVHLETCLDCRACETACPSGVDYHSFLEQYREKRYAEKPPSLLSRIGQKFVTHRKAMSLLFKTAFVARKIGAVKMMNKIGGKFLGLPRIGWRSFLQNNESHYPAIGQQQAKTAFFTGCIMDHLYADVHQATLRVLRWNGFAVDIPASQTCCGALHQHTGGYSRIKQLQSRNMRAFQCYDLVINNSAGCGAELKQYPEPEFVNKTKDVSEVLTSAKLRLPVHLDHGWRILFDAPCHLEHAQGIRQIPVDLLTKFGFLLVEYPESHLCCGAAGAYTLSQPRASSQILKMKMADILRTGEVKAIVTANPGCHLQLQKGCDLYNPGTSVWHFCEALDYVYRQDPTYRSTFQLDN